MPRKEDAMGQVGRPRKYGSAKALREAVNGYFNSISYTQVMMRGDEPVLNDSGEPIKFLVYVRPPTVSGLCIYLGIDRSTWNNYCDGELHPEFSDITSGARLIMEAYLEEQLVVREKSTQGIQFNLENNFGWKKKREVDLGTETRASMTKMSAMTMDEKLAAIRAVALDFDMIGGEGDDTPDTDD